MNIRLLLFTLCAVPALLLTAGCARRIKIDTTAYSDSSVIPNGFKRNASFHLSGGPVDAHSQSHDALEAKELQNKIAVMLKNRGYSVTHNNQADYFLIFNYGCQGQTVSYNTLKYFPGPSYVSTTFVGGRIYDEQTVTSGSYAYVPEQKNYFSKSLSLYVYDKQGYKQELANNGNAPSVHIWSGHSVGVDEYDDLRSYLDFLVVSMFKLFGTSGQTADTLYEGDVQVNVLRRYMPRA